MPETTERTKSTEHAEPAVHAVPNRSLKFTRKHRERQRNRRPMSSTALVGIGIVIAVVAFVAGTRSDQIYAAVAPIFGVKASSDTLDTKMLQQVYQNLRANFDGTIDQTKLQDGAISGMVTAAGDQYTVYMDPTEANQFEMDLSGEVYGIGAEIGVRDGQPTVLRIIDASPAKTAGLAVGDIFQSVDDKSVSGQTASQVASVVRGKQGTAVKLSMKRGDTTKEFTITRQKVSDPSVRSEMDGTTGVMTISRFDDQTADLARQAAQKFVSAGAKSVIVDLRGNGGGYLDAAQAVAGLWLDNKLVVSEKSNGKVVDKVYSTGKPILAGLRTVVLVNGGSASASEILAGALQDYNAATLVGEQTFGKGSVQQVFNYSGGRILKVTIAKWYTPNDKNIDKQGITPDKEVKLTSDDADKGTDPQMAAAKELVSL